MSWKQGACSYRTAETVMVYTSIIEKSEPLFQIDYSENNCNNMTKQNIDVKYIQCKKLRLFVLLSIKDGLTNDILPVKGSVFCLRILLFFLWQTICSEFFRDLYALKNTVLD